ncbi:hypothetical protein TrVFT333_003155 [Trichoderma virens FT-333]|nr:hypothetical protein TrVFT333_003155 [Trichoderma virens FT-333]
MAISLALPGAAITRAAWKAALSFEREDRESRAKDVGRIVGRILGLFMWTITDLGEAKTKGRQQRANHSTERHPTPPKNRLVPGAAAQVSRRLGTCMTCSAAVLLQFFYICIEQRGADRGDGEIGGEQQPYRRPNGSSPERSLASSEAQLRNQYLKFAFAAIDWRWKCTAGD